MKVKNIVFSGFAAAVLMSVGAANAATQVASKKYVDDQVDAVEQTVSQVKNDLSTNYTKTSGLDDVITGAVTDNAALKGALDAKESKSNKAGSITDANKGSTTEYPSVGAVVNWAEGRISSLSELPVNPSLIEDNSLVGDKLKDGTVGKDKLDQNLQDEIDGKQAALTEAQLNAANSGVTSTTVTQVETNKTNITQLQSDMDDKADLIKDVAADKVNNFATVNADGQYEVSTSKASDFATPTFVTTTISNALTAEDGVIKTELDKKQDNLTTDQMAAVNSGITTTLVEQISTNADDIDALESGKADKLQNVGAENAGTLAMVDENGQYQLADIKAADVATKDDVDSKIDAAIDGQLGEDGEIAQAIAGLDESKQDKLTAENFVGDGVDITIAEDGKITLSATDTDTVTTAETTGEGNVVTAISAENGALTVTKGAKMIPEPSAACAAGSGRCVLSVGTDGSLEWLDVTAPLDETSGE